jgi:Mg/Co/Ni transporter MgtE
MSTEKLLDYDIKISDDIENIIRQENEEDYKNLARQTEQIEDITHFLNNIINEGGAQLAEVDTTIIETNEVIDDININLEQAHKSRINGLLLKGTAIGVGVGFALGGLAGSIVGSYLGSISVGFLAGSIPLGSLSGGATYGIIKNKVNS